MQLRLILLDFDGTIADTFTETLRIFNDLSKKYGFDSISENELETARKMNVWELIKCFNIPKRKVPILLKRGKKMLHENLGNITVFEGMKELLLVAQEAGIPCGVVTSNSKKNVERFIELNELQNISFVKSCSRLLGKPREFKRILKKRQISTDNTIYIGDETRDIDAAHDVGIEVVAVTWGYNSKDAIEKSNPTHVVNTADELVSLLKQKIA